MTVVTHIIGLQGCGKSTLAALMVSPLVERGAVCAIVDSDSMAIDYKGDPEQAVAAHAHADHLFLEYFPQTFLRARPGDKVIHVAIWPELVQSPPANTYHKTTGVGASETATTGQGVANA